MAVKIRLSRKGRKKMPIYDIVVADARAPRDGRFIEKLGQYNPHTTPATINVELERALHWMMVGAQPTDTTRKILSVSGVMFKKHLQVGVNKGAITQEVADKRFEDWMAEKLSNRESKIAKLNSDKDSVKKAAFDAERKKKEDRESAKAEAAAAELAALEAQNAPAVEEVAEVEAEAATEVEAVAEVATEEAETPEASTDAPAETAE
jgi:small subunit ribosomal protein S16